MNADEHRYEFVGGARAGRGPLFGTEIISQFRQLRVNLDSFSKAARAWFGGVKLRFGMWQSMQPALDL